MKKKWLIEAFELLEESLAAPGHEPNELDWKLNLSPDKQRLAQHLSAFSNLPGGGCLVFGIGPKGSMIGVNDTQVFTIVTQLTNIGRAGVEPPIALDHTVESFKSSRILFFHVLESPIKPVHLRGKGIEQAYIRSGGTTRLASRQEIAVFLSQSQVLRWEDSRASSLLSRQGCVDRLHVKPIFEMLTRPVFTDLNELIKWMVAQRFVVEEPTHGVFITNLGAISAAKNLSDFPDLNRKAVRVIVYGGPNKAKGVQHQREGIRGYATAFKGLLKYVMDWLPQEEVLKKGLRRKQTVYPEIALREIIANALIHQDFTISGTGPLVEIFSNRVEISSPGGLLPSKQLDRLIGTHPESRNEHLARAFRNYRICEEQGSGLLKAGYAVEAFGLPPIHFAVGPNYFKVTLHAPRKFSQMLHQERLDACYQHTVLRYFSASAMTNKTLRERLRMHDTQTSMVSVLIQEAIEKGLIKQADPNNRSKKFAKYVPAWA